MNRFETLTSRLKSIRFYIFLILAFMLGLYSERSEFTEEFIDNIEDWVYLLQQTLVLVFLSGFLATVTGVAAGIFLTRRSTEKWSPLLFQGFNILSAVPTLAILAIVMTYIGIGFSSAVFGLWTVTILPIVRNTYQGIKEVPNHLVEAAKGQGMTGFQILLRVQIPNALFVIFAGVRTGFALNVGASPLTTLIAADSLGEYIFTGIQLNEFNSLLTGSLTIALLAIAIDFLLLQLQYWGVSRGVNPLMIKGEVS